MSICRGWWKTAKFNRLRIIEEPDYSDVTGNGPRVRCLCDCGNEKFTRLFPLKGGRVRSCGCWQKEGVRARNKANPIRKDRRGMRQGKLVFLNYVGVAKDVTQWNVRCDCGVEFVTRGTTKAKACRGCASEAKRGKGSPRWKGGRHMSGSGYVVIYLPGHPRASIQGYVLEHIVVAEARYGRPITTDQSVHHINGIRHDNSPDNLEVWDKAHPAGQRLTEKMDFYAQQLLLKADASCLNALYDALRLRLATPHPPK